MSSFLDTSPCRLIFLLMEPDLTAVLFGEMMNEDIQALMAEQDEDFEEEEVNE